MSVNSIFTKESVCDFSRLNITFEKCYADTDTLTFYDYVKVEANGAILRPNAVRVSEQEQIEKDFIDYNSKLIKWQPAWNLFEVLMSPFKRKKYKKRADNFINLFNSETIFDGCYR